jgi:hypothetical protein
MERPELRYELFDTLQWFHFRPNNVEERLCHDVGNEIIIGPRPNPLGDSAL